MLYLNSYERAIYRTTEYATSCLTHALPLRNIVIPVFASYMLWRVMDLFLVYPIEPGLRIRESPAQGHMVYRCGLGARSGYFRKRSHDRRFSNDDLVTIVRKNASEAFVLEGVDTLIVMGS